METIQVTTDEKKLFLEWVGERESLLLAQLETIRALQKKLAGDSVDGHANNIENGEEPTWVEKINEAFKALDKPLTSGEIIDFLMNKYKQLNQKGRKYVTKAVTSKLWIMSDKGELTKEEKSGKNVYTLKNKAA